MEQKVIDKFEGEARFLSNFSPAEVIADGMAFLSVEHTYQAMKTLDKTERSMIQQVKSPGQAKRLGRTVTIRSDWEEVKVNVMRDLLKQKFAEDPLKQMLIDTGDAQLIEGNDWNDRFWGVCRGEGENMLGRLLMEIRESVRQV